MAVVLSRRRWTPMLVAVVILVGGAPACIWEYRAASLDPTIFELAAWARERLPERSIVVVRARSARTEGDPTLLPSRYWWPYLLGRETDFSRLPASEPRFDPRVREKEGMASDPAVARRVAKRRGKELFWLVAASQPPVPGAVRVDLFRGLVALDRAGP
jgi:hypothetical protein